MAMSLFRRNTREPIQKLLRRQKRRHPKEVEAILNNPKAFAELEKRIELLAKQKGVHKLFSLNATDEPRQFGAKLSWFLANWPEIFQMIKDIMGMFGSFS